MSLEQLEKLNDRIIIATKEACILNEEIPGKMKELKKSDDKVRKYFNDNLQDFLTSTQYEDYKKGHTSLRFELNEHNKQVLQTFLDNKNDALKLFDVEQVPLKEKEVISLFIDDMFSCLMYFNGFDFSKKGMLEKCTRLNELESDNLYKYSNVLFRIDKINKIGVLLEEHKDLNTDYIDKEIEDLTEERADELTKQFKKLHECFDTLTDIFENINKWHEELKNFFLYPQLELKIYKNNIKLTLYKNIEAQVSEVKKKQDVFVNPVDKVNNTIWNDFVLKGSGQYAQIGFNLDNLDTPLNLITNKKTGGYVSIDVSYDGDDNKFKISKPLSAFDKRVFTATCNLFLEGCGIDTNNLKDINKKEIANIIKRLDNTTQEISYTRIYNKTGGKGKPNSVQLGKISYSVEYLLRTWININSENETGYKYAKSKDSGHLLDGATHEDKDKNGKLLRGYVKIKGLSSLFSYALKRQMVTTFPQAMIDNAPLSITPNNVSIMDYINGQIAWRSYENQEMLIYWETFFEENNITRNKKREKDTVKTYLEYLKIGGYIKDYKIEKTHFSIQGYKEPPKTKKGKKSAKK